jgi:hypothetical protein
MKITIENLQDTFQIGYAAFEESRVEAIEIYDAYHNRQYTDAQIASLRARGQPAETFNVIKLFARMLIGYYETVNNTVQVTPAQEEDIPLASLLNDIVKQVFEKNNFRSEGNDIKLDGLLTGLMVTYVDVVDTGQVDEFGRNMRHVNIHHVPSHEIVLDPGSKQADYSDAAYIHRFKWLSEEQTEKMFGKAAVTKLSAYENHLNIEEAEFTFSNVTEFTGIYRQHKNFLIVHSILRDDDGVAWSVYWSGDDILEKVALTYKEVISPYRVQKLNTSIRTEYYGIFREIIETQKAINQALLTIQLTVNTHKVLVQEGAVRDLNEFINSMGRVTGVIPVLQLSGIKVENMTSEIANQYTIINNGFDRIQQVLGINDSFLGQAFAADSGRKVKLQQGATAMSLGYVTSRINNFYRLLGTDVINLIKQFYTASQAMRIANEVTGERWVEINQPLLQLTGGIDPETGQPSVSYVWEEVLDPATGEPMLDAEGNIIIAPVPTAETEISFTEFDVTVHAVNYNNEDEATQLMLETSLAGPIGSMLAQVDPAGFLQAASLALATTRTRYSTELANIYKRAAERLSQDPEAQQQAIANQSGQQGQQGQFNGAGSTSKDLKLPQNTNEVPF